MCWKCDKNCKGETCSKLASRDLLCVTVILVMVIIGLITLNVGCDIETSARYSFASTLISIVLSVIAIIMSLLSEFKSDRAQESLDRTLKTLKEAGEHIDKNSKAQIAQMRSLDSKISSKLDRLEKRLDKLPNWDRSVVPSAKLVKTLPWIDIGDKDEK